MFYIFVHSILFQQWGFFIILFVEKYTQYFKDRKPVVLMSAPDWTSYMHVVMYTKFGWNWPSTFGEDVENVKSLRQTTGRLWSQYNIGHSAHVSLWWRSLFLVHTMYSGLKYLLYSVWPLPNYENYILAGNPECGREYEPTFTKGKIPWCAHVPVCTYVLISTYVTGETHQHTNNFHFVYFENRKYKMY